MKTEKEIIEYSQAFARKITEYFFIDHTHITGQEILKFCDILQINLLIIKQLYFKWQQEIQNLKSPYFDYEHREVKKNLQILINSLSNHIAVKKDDFMPFVMQATQETLTWLIYPKEKFRAFCLQFNKEIITHDDLLPHQKYWHIHKKIWEKLVLILQEKPLSLFDIEWTWAELLRESRDSIEIYQPIFESILATDWTKIIPNHTIENQNIEKETDFFEKIEIPKTEWVADDIVDLPNSLNIQFAKNQEDKKDLHTQFTQTKIHNLRESIALNEKFLFINQLFDGNTLAFNDALDKIENCGTKEDALLLIKEKYERIYHWQEDKEEVNQFYEIINRRFL
jgi:hypothetical protein